MTTTSSRKVSKSGERKMFRNLLAAFANAGHIDLSLPEKDIWKQFKKVADSLDDDFDVVIDHTANLLFQARRAKEVGDFSMSVLMYATWVEHSLNAALLQLAAGRKMLKSHSNAMIKEASLRTKSTWLLPLLGAKALSTETVARIQRLADSRNAFIHYKWGQLSNAAEGDQKRALEDAEKVVRTLQSLGRKNAKIVSGRSKKVRSLVPSGA